MTSLLLWDQCGPGTVGVFSQGWASVSILEVTLPSYSGPDCELYEYATLDNMLVGQMCLW